MEPVVTPLVAEISLALRDFVGVMREHVVDAAAVNVKIFTKEFHTYARALNVPAGVTDTPRAIPLKLLVVKL